MKSFVNLSAGGLAVLAASGSVALADYGSNNEWSRHHDMFGGYGSGMMGGMGLLLMVALTVLIVVVVVQLFRHGGTARPHHSALAILKERYARGEIDHEEYEERRKRLE